MLAFPLPFPLSNLINRYFFYVDFIFLSNGVFFLISNRFFYRQRNSIILSPFLISASHSDCWKRANCSSAIFFLPRRVTLTIHLVSVLHSLVLSISVSLFLILCMNKFNIRCIRCRRSSASKLILICCL